MYICIVLWPNHHVQLVDKRTVVTLVVSPAVPLGAQIDSCVTPMKPFFVCCNCFVCFKLQLF